MSRQKNKAFSSPLSQAGFTLIEIAIVLVVIGLLLGGILKGKEMVRTAKLKKVITTADGVRSAVYAYLDKFGQLPGDGVGSPPVYNGQIANASAAFTEMFGEGIVPSPNPPKDPFGGDIVINYLSLNALYTGSPAGHFIGFPGAGGDNQISLDLDTMFDDANVATGGLVQKTAGSPAVKAVWMPL